MPSPADPVAVRLFGIEIRWYAIFILAGILAGIWLVRALARRRGMDPNFPLDVLPWVILAGIVGARLYYFLLRWDYFLANPDQALTLRLGGLTIHGALAGGIAMLVYLCHRAGQSFLAWADLAVPGVALGQAIGRWGNWANQEAFGRPSDLPWAVAIDPTHRPPVYAAATHFQPTFLYESLFDLAIAAALAWLALRVGPPGRLRPGDVLWIYFILYGAARFVIEGMRTDSLYIGPQPAAYWLSLALIAVGVVMLVLRHLPPRDRRPATGGG
jgi:phosphatidylglycerol:prolipoprotein diacylglycerol transferase